MSAVLIVEDEKHIAEGLRYNLKAEGYEVDVAGSAEQAATLLLDKPNAYDVVVLDVMLPGMDGFMFASKLRERGQFVPILMLTARGQVVEQTASIMLTPQGGSSGGSIEISDGKTAVLIVISWLTADVRTSVENVR